jgi:hypothetical protein
MKLLIHRDKCRHFNGIQHDACEAGVRYEDVRAKEGRPYATLPCVDVGYGVNGECTNRSLLTQEEHAQLEAQFRASFDEMCKAAAAGKCHVCGANLEPSKVVGHCRYGACGHRQGMVASVVEVGDE